MYFSFQLNVWKLIMSCIDLIKMGLVIKVEFCAFKTNIWTHGRALEIITDGMAKNYSL